MKRSWNHAICDSCWLVKRPQQEPVRLKEEFRSTKKCCFCGERTRSGIFVRGDPDETACKGAHE